MAAAQQSAAATTEARVGTSMQELDRRCAWQRKHGRHGPPCLGYTVDYQPPLAARHAMEGCVQCVHFVRARNA
jgi:hypothetical protein